MERMFSRKENPYVLKCQHNASSIITRKALPHPPRSHKYFETVPMNATSEKKTMPSK
jgi:hypothetical protein